MDIKVSEAKVAMAGFFCGALVHQGHTWAAGTADAIDASAASCPREQIMDDRPYNASLLIHLMAAKDEENCLLLSNI